MVRSWSPWSVDDILRGEITTQHAVSSWLQFEPVQKKVTNCSFKKKKISLKREKQKNKPFVLNFTPNVINSDWFL